MPLVPQLVQSFFTKPPSQRVNPDEVVALGAAMQAYALAAAKLKPSVPRALVTQEDQSLVTNVGGALMGNNVPTGPVREEAISASEIVLVNEPPPPPDLPEQISFRRSAPELHFDIGSNEQPAPPPPPPPVLGARSAAGQPPPFRPSASPGTTMSFGGPPQPASSPFANDVPTARNLGQIMGDPSSSGNLESAAPFFRPAAPPQPLLIDVTPLNLNVETVGGYCDMLIAANTPIPCDRTRVFLTSSDNQTTATVRVAQGPERKFGDNTYLGEVELSGLPPAPRGEVKIQVTFEIDADGILQVKAKDEVSGNQAVARLRLLGANTDQADVEAMQRRQARMAVG